MFGLVRLSRPRVDKRQTDTERLKRTNVHCGHIADGRRTSRAGKLSAGQLLAFRRAAAYKPLTNKTHPHDGSPCVQPFCAM